MEPAVLKAHVGSLEQELELKDETLRAQADELDALRRELRIKDSDLRELQTSQRLAHAENKKVQTERRELEEVVASQKREVVTAHFGLNGEKPLSYLEIAEGYALSKERVRQIERSAL